MADGGEEDPPVILDRSSRATRGKRMTKLLDDEVEEDEAFWNQDALKEEAHDVNYEEEPEVADEFDSDFADDESEPDDDAANIAEDRLPVKKRLIFPGKTLKKKNRKKVISKIEKDSEMEKSSDTKDSIQPEHHDAPDDLEGEKTVRKSTRTSVVVRQAERDAIQAALQATTKPIKRKKEGEEKRMTQEEMLLEAAQTEIMNLKNLERVLAREEEVKKRAVVHKAVYTGPQIRFYSSDGISHLEFSNGASFESGLSTAPIPYPQKSVCVVTGLPARYRDPKTGLPYANKEAFKIIRERYRDPKTGLPYANKEAFKIIRERFLKEEANKKKQKSMDMGALFNLVSSEGIQPKRKRSSGAHLGKSSDLRLGARFRRIPALENLDLD